MKRRTRAEIDRLRVDLYTIAANERPMTLRNLFYRAVVKMLVEAVNADQIVDWQLPTHAPKEKDIAAGWIGECCEAEAIPIAQMRELVDDAIRSLIDVDALNDTREAELADRARLDQLLGAA